MITLETASSKSMSKHTVIIQDETTNIPYYMNSTHHISVDELIAFLEHHRGKNFVNYATDNTSFYVKDNEVLCADIDMLVEDGFVRFEDSFCSIEDYQNAGYEMKYT